MSNEHYHGLLLVWYSNFHSSNIVQTQEDKKNKTSVRRDIGIIIVGNSLVAATIRNYASLFICPKPSYFAWRNRSFHF
jgi:hypothetical protein